MLKTNLFNSLIATFMFVIGVHIYAEVSISGNLLMNNMDFSLRNDEISITIHSIQVSYNLTVNDGWTGKISPCVEFTIEKISNSALLIYRFNIGPEIESTLGYDLDVDGVANYDVQFKHPDQMTEDYFLFIEGEDYVSTPQFRQYKNISSNLSNQDFNIGLTQIVKNDNNVLLTTFKLRQNYPNPFNSSTTVSFELPEASKVRVTVFNSCGQLIEVLGDENYPRGIHSIKWDASTCSSGMYYYKMETDNFLSIKKCILLR
jgi:hypothetical protein